MIRFKKEGVRWELSGDYRSLLDRLLADPGQSVKSTPTKLVTRHNFDDRTYYVKRYLNAAVRFRPLKYYFKSSEARTEWGIAQRYEAFGIPVVPHLALGERWGWSGLLESILVTEGFDGVALSRSDLHQRADVQTELGKLVRLMHDKGISQPDLHHNILVRENPLEMRRIDVDRSEVKPQLTPDECFENLAFFNIFVPLGDHFFKTYGGPLEWRSKLNERSEAIRRPMALRRARRAVTRNLRFDRFDFGGRQWWVRLEFLNDDLRQLLGNPEQGGEGFVVQPTKRALEVHQMAYHLELLTLAVPRPVAATDAGYTVSEKIRDGYQLADVEDLDIECAWVAGKWLGQFHANGFTHGQLTENSLIWDNSGKVYLQDVEPVKYHDTLQKESAAVDLRTLAQIARTSRALTREHRKAFLQAYRKERSPEL